MAVPVELPKLGNTVEECIISAWHKSPGDEVAEGDVLAEVETDKATFEVTAPAAGTLLATFFTEGDLVPVFTTLCVLGAPGEDPEPFRPGAEGGAVAAAAAPAGAAPAAAPVEDSGAPWSPRARRFARDHQMPMVGAQGSGAGGRVVEADARERLA